MSFCSAIFSIIQSISEQNFCSMISISVKSPFTPLTSTWARYLLLSESNAIACFLLSFKFWVSSLTTNSSRSPLAMYVRFSGLRFSYRFFASDWELNPAAFWGYSDRDSVNDYFMYYFLFSPAFSYPASESSMLAVSHSAISFLIIMARCSRSPLIIKFLVSESIQKLTFLRAWVSQCVTSFRIFQLQSWAAVPLLCLRWLRVAGTGNPTFLYTSVTISPIFVPFSNWLEAGSFTQKLELEICFTSAGVIILKASNHLNVLLSSSKDINQIEMLCYMLYLANVYNPMNFYDVVSTIFTLLGTTVLVYRTVQQLEVGTKTTILEKMCTKWVIFMIFLKLEYVILAIVEIIPLGSLALLVIKFLLFMPENPISHKIYKRVSKKLEKIKMDEYHTKFGKYMSLVCKHVAIVMMNGVEKIAEYVNSHDIEAVEVKIIDVIKIFEYKKAAINMRTQAHKSAINDELNESEFNTSASEDQILPFLPVEKAGNSKGEGSPRKTETGARMSKILEDLEDNDDKETMTLNAEQMIVKPNKNQGKAAVYEKVKIQFYHGTNKITFEDKNKAVESGTLKQIKWITKNMINIELILAEGRSKVIKLVEKADVAKWVEPVCEILEKKKTK